MFDFQLCKDGGAIICDEDITNVINEHFVKADGSEGGFDNVCYCEGCGYISGADILA
jgi:hypothetical protein